MLYAWKNCPISRFKHCMQTKSCAHLGQRITFFSCDWIFFFFFFLKSKHAPPTASSWSIGVSQSLWITFDWIGLCNHSRIRYESSKVLCSTERDRLLIFNRAGLHDESKWLSAISKSQDAAIFVTKQHKSEVLQRSPLLHILFSRCKTRKCLPNSSKNENCDAKITCPLNGNHISTTVQINLYPIVQH